ncbi:MAG: zinc-binding dehydrogenase [Lentisphaerae bacterium]|nr:zinc-binding dehydrogenase [Lentisphaerota bacterium]
MKAAILVETRKPLVVADITVPQDLAYGQVHVRLHYSGICGSQLNEIDGAKGPDKYLPHLLGHEGSGIVQRVGHGVKRVKPGDHVVLHWMPAQGAQAETPTYGWNGRPVNAGWVTTFNEEAVVSENRVTVIPADFDMRIAPLLGCAVTTAVGVVNNDAGLKIGQSLLVLGLGGVGISIVKAAELVSAYPIVGVDLLETKLELAKQSGLTTGLLASDPRLREKILEQVGPAGVDVAIDVTGIPRMIELAYELTHPRGRTILVGVPKQGQKINIYTLPLHFEQVLKGSHGGDVEPDVVIPRLIRLMRAGRLRLDDVLTDEYTLDQINLAVDRLRTGQAGRILIRLNGQ